MQVPKKILTRDEYDRLWSSQFLLTRKLAAECLDFIPSEAQILEAFSESENIEVFLPIFDRRDYELTERIIEAGLKHPKQYVRRTFWMRSCKKTESQIEMGLQDEDESVQAFVIKDLNNMLTEEQRKNVLRGRSMSAVDALLRRLDWSMKEDDILEVIDIHSMDLMVVCLGRDDCVVNEEHVNLIMSGPRSSNLFKALLKNKSVNMSLEQFEDWNSAFISKNNELVDLCNGYIANYQAKRLKSEMDMEESGCTKFAQAL